MRPLVGIDFDNTIVSYDHLMHRIAVDRGLISSNGQRTKRSVRDRIRELPNGEIEWQKLQAVAYGPLMQEAHLIEGVADFVRSCRRAGMMVVIVSHKTEYAPYDETRTNLRSAALDWMAAHRFFEADGLDLRRADVYFESTRAEKIARIQAIGCSHFIDDLEEVFLDPSFPSEVIKILYAPNASVGAAAGATVIASWREAREYFFHPSA